MAVSFFIFDMNILKAVDKLCEMKYYEKYTVRWMG